MHLANLYFSLFTDDSPFRYAVSCRIYMLIHALPCDADHAWSRIIASPWASIVYMLLDGQATQLNGAFVPNLTL